MGGGFRGGSGGRRDGGNFFPHPDELLIWAYPENLVKIGLLVEAVDTFCGTGHGARGTGTHRDYIDNLSLSFGFGPGLWLGLG